jgi:type IV pilus assembly protein PilA
MFRANFNAKLKQRLAPGGCMAQFCAACGNTITADDKFCRVCGRVAPAGPAATSAGGATTALGGVQTSGKAVGSLICGLLFFIPFLFVVAIVLGHLALSEIRKSAGRLKGEGIAIAGLVLGYMWIVGIPIILIVAAIAIPNLLRAKMAANESSAVASVRTLQAAENTYSAAHPAQGYTCSLSDLAAGTSISGPLATGQMSGYAFELTGCSAETEGGSNVKYQIVAYPLRVNQTGVRAFCSNESAEIKVDSGGSARACLESGRALE